MNITVFTDITTEQVLLALEEESKTYTDLYVDMDNAPERKFVKNKAADIQDLLKKLDRARIDKSKNYKTMVEKEALLIKERLEAANLPFTYLIDAHNRKRAAILAEEKRIADAKELALQIERDHEFALLMDAQVMADKDKAELEKKEYEGRIAILAIAGESRVRAAVQEAEERATLARQSDINHRKEINRGILDALLSEASIMRGQGKTLILAIQEGKIPNVRIDY